MPFCVDTSRANRLRLGDDDNCDAYLLTPEEMQTLVSGFDLSTVDWSLLGQFYSAGFVMAIIPCAVAFGAHSLIQSIRKM